MSDLVKQLELEATPKCAAPYDPGFRPAALWVRAYRRLVAADKGARKVIIALRRPDGMVFHHTLEILSDSPDTAAANYR